jgi:hypothetical protein
MSVCDSPRRLRRTNTKTPFIRPSIRKLQQLIPETRRFDYRTTLRSRSQQLNLAQARGERSDPHSDVISIEAQPASANLHPATTVDKCKSDSHTKHISSSYTTSTSASTDVMNGSAIRTYTHEAMMRNKPASSMQKTYDECYLICSTAVYFEGQV